MGETDRVFVRSLSFLLAECFDGPPGGTAYMLNPGDPGLLRQLDAIDAKTASTRSMPGRTTIAAHVDHVLYGIDLLNRWADGEANPWATADWDASWTRGVVDDAAWRSLRDRLRAASAKWRKYVAARAEFDDVAACGSISSLAHTMYHVGAIRQILAATGK